MDITPLEIRNREFTRKMRGVDPQEVSRFLESVSEEMERLISENADLHSETDRLKEKLAGYSQLEDTIQKTLLMAQKSSEDAISNARKQAELIIQDARNKGIQIENEFAQMKSAKRQFEIELETMIETFRKKLKEFGEQKPDGLED